MKRFELIAHTADIRLAIEGSTLEELFTAALEGMASIILQSSQEAKKDQSTSIKVKSSDVTALLIDFLSDTLTKTQVSKTIFTSALFHELTEHQVHVTLLGFKVDHFDEDIKAVTYHEADVIKNHYGNYQTTIVFDI